MEQETRPLLVSEDDHPGGPSSSTSQELADNDPPVDEMALQEADASAEEAARFEALLLLPWHKRPSIFWLLPFAFVIAIVLGMSGAPREQRKQCAVDTTIATELLCCTVTKQGFFVNTL